MAKSSPQDQKNELEFLQKQKDAYQNAQKLGTTVKVIKSSSPWLAGGFEWLS